MTLDNFENIVGKKVYLKVNRESSVSHPWQGIEVPALITKEYDDFFMATVLAHRAPHAWGDSYPYEISINKKDVLVGDMGMRVCE